LPQDKLAGLEPAFRGKVVAILQELAGKGWKPFVAEGLRTQSQQDEKVRLGYSRTRNSRHLTGHAADIVDRRWGWGGPAASTSHQFWQDLGTAARARGLTWGGDWRSFKDVAHIEVPRGG
jgi:peptidoglycan L-alanyl-D-glutamate endopeptidase CwlK